MIHTVDFPCRALRGGVMKTRGGVDFVLLLSTTNFKIIDSNFPLLFLSWKIFRSS